MTTTTDTDRCLEVARTIVSQIPTATQWELAITKRIAMTEQLGGVRLVLGGGMKETRGRFVEVVLNGSDEYEIEVYRLGRKGSKDYGRKVQVTKIDGIHCGELAEVIRSLVFGARA